MNIDLNEIDLNNLPSAPLPVRVLVVGLVCALLLFLGYWFDTGDQLKALEQEKHQEQTLKQSFEKKYHRASHLAAYKEQMKVIQASFGALLRQLPEKTEVPGLVEDISHQGLASGLEFKSIKLKPEKHIDFYAELPIDIIVVGTYHQLADFVSNIASLPRIVTLHDFTIIRTPKISDEHESLTMNISVKTYRYTGDEEKS